MTIRAGLTDAGLPCAIQIVGERGSEETLLAIAALYEEMFDPFQRWPAFPFRDSVRGANAKL